MQTPLEQMVGMCHDWDTDTDPHVRGCVRELMRQNVVGHGMRGYENYE